MNYKGVYLILGGSSDIGCELLKQLNYDNTNTMFLIHYFSNNDKIKQIEMNTTTNINNNSINCIQADLSKIEEVDKLIEIIKTEYICPTHIVHLPANKFEYKKLKEFHWNEFCYDMEIQVHSLIQILNSFLPEMIRRKEYNKVVIMLSSVTISNPPKYLMSYNMIKFTLLGLMKSLASDYSGKKININAISPSMIDTKFLNNIDSRIIELNATNSNGNKNANVCDIVPVIKFLLSEDSNYINGVNLNVSNGNVI